MASLNKWTGIGNLGRDPELRYLPSSGEAVANISIACTEKWRDKNTGETKEQTEWVNVSFFGKLAEVVGQYLKKGSQVYIEGGLRTRKYTDKNGVEKYATEVRASEMKMLGGKPEGQRQEPAASQQPAPATSGFDDFDGDIPF